MLVVVRLLVLRVRVATLTTWLALVLAMTPTSLWALWPMTVCGMRVRGRMWSL